LPIKYKKALGGNGSFQKKKEDRRRDPFHMFRHCRWIELASIGTGQRVRDLLPVFDNAGFNKLPPPASRVIKPQRNWHVPRPAPRILRPSSPPIDNGDESREDATARTTLRPDDNTNCRLPRSKFRHEDPLWRFQCDSNAPSIVTYKRTRFIAVCIPYVYFA